MFFNKKNDRKSNKINDEYDEKKLKRKRQEEDDEEERIYNELIEELDEIERKRESMSSRLKNVIEIRSYF